MESQTNEKLKDDDDIGEEFFTFKKKTEQRSREPGQRNGQQKRKAGLRGQYRGRIGPDPHEGGLTQVDLARIAGADLKPDGDDGADHHHIQDSDDTAAHQVRRQQQ